MNKVSSITQCSGRKMLQAEGIAKVKGGAWVSNKKKRASLAVAHYLRGRMDNEVERGQIT